MQEAVSGILVDRAREAEGLSRMLVLSVGAHVVLVAGLWLMPSDWRSTRPEEPALMTVSISGVAGPETGGMTPIAGRAVQEVVKPDAPKALDTPPAAKPPEMIEPERVAKPAPRPRPVTKPDEKSKARTPTVGPEVKTGSSRVNTGGASIPFGGLASGGGKQGDGVQLDVQNFCCPEYIRLMRQRIQENWNPNQGATGQPVVKFTIRKDGVLTQIELEKSSGQALLDLEARRAVHKTMQLPPLPREFDGNHLTVHLTFDFKR